MTAFRQALKAADYIEGRNVEIYFRSSDGQTDRLVTLAGDIVGRRVAAIVTTGGGAAALAAYAATTTIPICLRKWRRSGRIRSSHEPQSARWQRNWGAHLSASAGGKATGAPPRAGSGCRVDRGFAQPNQCEFSNSIEGCSGCCSRPRATSEHPEHRRGVRNCD